MSSVLVINAAGRETRVALVEQGHIAEFYLERKKDRGIVGNIYKGRVTRVLPGMQAAFVDIGLDKAGFLYVGDVLFDPDMTRHQFDMTEGENDEDVDEVPAEEADDAAHPAPSAPTPPDAHAADAAPAPAVTEAAPPELASGAEVVAAAVAEANPAPTGADVVAAAVSESNLPIVEGQPEGVEGAVLAAAPVVETDKLEAQRTQAPRDVRFKEKEPKEKGHGDRGPRAERGEKRKAEPPKKQQKIEDLLKVGQEVLVQISKDPIGTKGARITSHISIPGRHLVFMPTVDHVGISRRIGNEKERRRLRDTVERLRPPGTGFIVRTVAENVPQEKLEADIRFLIEVWNETVKKNEKVHRAGLMHPDLDLILRATRDLFAQDIEKLIIDDREEFERVQRFVEAQDPALKERVVLHDGEEPIFDAYGIEEEIKRATARKVWLRSGGYLIIDQAEALTAIDVNSGRYVGKKNLEDTIVKINTEAAKEIVYQLRLRNIGGIIICDFIDMEKQANRDKVFKSLHEALGRDKAKTNVLRISELGLVEMTRKRVRESIGRVLHENCGYCAGQGYVKTATTVAYEIFRELRRSAGAYKDPTIVVQAQTEVANVLQNEEREELRHLMDRFNKSIQIKARTDFHREQYDIYARPISGVEIKIAATTVEHDPSTYTSNRKPGSSEAKFDRERGATEAGGGGGGGGRGPERERGGGGGGGGGGERGGGERGDRGSRRDRGGRDRGGRGGGGGGGGGQQNQQNRPPRPSSPDGGGASSPPANSGTPQE
ncbi:MAG: Rne/Rng family ribonuclease [Archangium sp.]|nr:Rne/Rng family ribonuclease [Archangium sp.]MDP3156297.1 Rne/Rng family ribonuclease [Archangium sp.]MDP3570341.1 Rne/Rng family ribonuclease [Archangium sp.]